VTQENAEISKPGDVSFAIRKMKSPEDTKTCRKTENIIHRRKPVSVSPVRTFPLVVASLLFFKISWTDVQGGKGFTPTLPTSEDFTLEFTLPEVHNLGLFTITETQCINEPRGFLNDSAIPKNVSVSRT
jgi:hypothetical protein